MVRVSSKTFGTTIERGKIYYFKSKNLIATDQPHYFIVIATPSDDLLIFSCCTTQFKKRALFIKLNKISQSTLVWIKPNCENKLPEDSYVDCNNYFKYSKQDIIQMYESDQIEFIGYILESKLEEIRQGFQDSPLIEDEIKGII